METEPFIAYEKVTTKFIYRCSISKLQFIVLSDNIVNCLDCRYVYIKLKKEDDEQDQDDFYIRISSVFKENEIDLNSFEMLECTALTNDFYLKFTNKKSLSKFRLMYKEIEYC